MRRSGPQLRITGAMKRWSVAGLLILAALPLRAAAPGSALATLYLFVIAIVLIAGALLRIEA